jgi:putative toxin-antitoxin system antitoxin component (TIGR02293 family)
MGALRILTELELVKSAREGITKKDVNNIIKITGLTQVEFGKYIDLTSRAIQRKSLNDKLSTSISEKALLISNLYGKGSQAFEGIDNFKEWMDTPNLALGNVKPKEYLDTFSGIEYLMEELGRIEHGFMV